jgi:hypothetical protein
MISSSLKLEEPHEISESDRIGNFRLLKRIQLDYTEAVVTKWQSQETGLRVVHVDFEGTFSAANLQHSNSFTGPIINGYFAVGTESKASPI